MRITYRGRLLN